MRTPEEWDQWYEHRDPWHYEGTAEDVVRTRRLIDILRHARFKHGLDLGCGEGWVTDALSHICENTLGIDISARAIERARARFPHIRFEQGDLLEALAQPEVFSIPFDLVLASEVLYYLQTDAERQAAVDALGALGSEQCLFCFSVIVNRGSPARRYFTSAEFVDLLRSRFNVIGWFPSVAEQPLLMRLGLSAGRRSQLAARALDRWTRTRRPDQCRHIGYFALKA